MIPVVCAAEMATMSESIMAIRFRECKRMRHAPRKLFWSVGLILSVVKCHTSTIIYCLRVALTNFHIGYKQTPSEMWPSCEFKR